MSKGKEKRKLTAELPGSATSWREMLVAYPIRNVAASTEQDDATLRVSIPTRKAWWYSIPPVCWVVRPPEHKILKIDRVGRSVWDLCDGETTVERIIELFAERHDLTFHESRVSVTNYLKLLIKRGALAIAL